VEPLKNNPFEQKVKPAFEDLEDIGFDLDSDRPVHFEGNQNKNAPAAAVKNELFGEKNNNV
jgi:hypothetical protein